MAKTKPRGRRAEKKAKEDEFNPEQDKILLNHIEEETPTSSNIPNTFFGLVDSNELDYFKQAESTLNINAFDSDEERQGFITSVLEEARGKELKLVTNQICSKLMERLVLFATDQQLKNIFKQFSNHFTSLAYHKYSSHVLETLLVRAAALIEKELGLTDEEKAEIAHESEEQGEDNISMEELFVSMLKEFEPQLQTMVDHQYASHVLRLLILILAGKELPSSTVSNSTLRSKKSKIARKMIEIKDNEDFNRAFQTPSSFKNELRNCCQSISKSLETQRARELAIHKVASPVLQLIIQVEGLVDRERTFWHLVFCKDSEDRNPKEEAFVEYLLSDPVGSHFLESIIKNDGARPKYIERLYKLYMKDRIFKLAKRSTTGVYIIQALLFKLKPVEVEFILDNIIPELSSLISISENQNLDLAQKLIDASIIRGNYRRDEIISQLFIKFAPNYNIEEPQLNTSAEFIENVLQLTGSTLGNTRGDWPTAEERKRSLFLEKLMEYDYKFVICSWLNFMALPVERFIQMCFHGVFSHVVEKALIVIPASEGEPKPVMILRKRLLNIFQGQIVGLSCNSYGSHIVDHLWNFTVLLPMYKDRIASELASDSHKVKESTYGRLVWKNWGMELFMRKKYDWKALVKQQEQEYFGETGEEGGDTKRAKKPIELKMERLAEEKRRKEEQALKAESGYLKRKLEESEDGPAHEKKQKLRGRRR
ncbi:NOP9 [[Candida] subhashii]|uniref:Nucleolar protein 9 n=1 Tax=[Candida] subhashii TaxID=561895 RepID=A0A8J5QH56_9ASCO|nr:NOP9 [[Candida] subhashii]KAG7661290.1 NOP9 [[Candida] subhashii]